MMTDQYEVTFVRLTFGEPQKVDGIIALGVFSEKEIDFLRSLSFAIVFVNSNQHNYEFDQVQVDFERGLEQMVSYLLDQKRYTGLGYIGGIYDGANGTHRHPPSGRHPAHLGKAWSVRSPNLPCGGNQSRKWLCSGQEGRGRAYLAEAVLLGSDEVAEGALEAFRELGVRVPKDVAVTSIRIFRPWRASGPHRHLPGDVPGLCVGKRPGTAFGRISQRPFPGSDRHGAHSPEDWRHGLNYPSGYQRAFPL